jgi:hypothetical protein
LNGCGENFEGKRYELRREGRERGRKKEVDEEKGGEGR